MRMVKVTHLAISTCSIWVEPQCLVSYNPGWACGGTMGHPTLLLEDVS